MESNLDVISVGNLNMDFICRIGRLPARDEKLLIEDLVQRPGGGAANFAAACSRLGMRSGLIGCVGTDRSGMKILEDLRREGVDTSHIRIADAQTGLVFSFSTPKGDHFLAAHRGANLLLKPEDIDDKYIKGAKLAHASSVTPEVAMAVGSRARELGAVASLDVGAELAELKKRKLLGALELFDICFMNRRAYRKVFKAKPSKRGILKNFPSGLKILALRDITSSRSSETSRIAVPFPFSLRNRSWVCLSALRSRP